MEPVREGLLGLILFLSHWLAPQNDNVKLSAQLLRSGDSARAVVRCELDLAWNQQMEQLVDAGIPLRFKFSSAYDISDTASFYRTLTFNVVAYTYTITDSSSTLVQRSREYPMILLALRDFCRWEVNILPSSERFWAEAAILPSHAAQLDRKIDMSRIWGRKRVSCEIKPSQELAKKARK